MDQKEAGIEPHMNIHTLIKLRTKTGRTISLTGIKKFSGLFYFLIGTKYIYLISEFISSLYSVRRVNASDRSISNKASNI